MPELKDAGHDDLGVGCETLLGQKKLIISG
jgi:hypothetical protein